jgi:transcriptional regulator with XRE-family HTH domain
MQREINPIDYQIGQNIKARRESMNISQKVLGANIPSKLDHRTISVYESGHLRIPACVIAEIAILLECPVGELFDGIPELLQARKNPISAEAKTIHNEMLEAMRGLDDIEVQKAIKNMVVAIVDGVHAKFTKGIYDIS